jgi:hypothetical protein
MNEKLPPYFETEFCNAKRVNAGHQWPYFATSFETDLCDAQSPDSTGSGQCRETCPS